MRAPLASKAVSCKLLPLQLLPFKHFFPLAPGGCAGVGQGKPVSISGVPAPFHGVEKSKIIFRGPGPALPSITHGFSTLLHFFFFFNLRTCVSCLCGLCTLGQHLPKSVPWALKIYLKQCLESQVLTTLGDLVHMVL